MKRLYEVVKKKQILIVWILFMFSFIYLPFIVLTFPFKIAQILGIIYAIIIGLVVWL